MPASSNACNSPTTEYSTEEGAIAIFESAGASATVRAPLTPIGGDRVVVGFAGLVDGPLDAPGMREAALAKAAATGYLGAEGA